MAKEKAELVFITVPGMGHFTPMVEIARRLVASAPNHNHNISALILTMKPLLPDDKMDSYVKSINSNNNYQAIEFLELPPPSDPPELGSKDVITLYQEVYKPIIKQTLVDRYYGSSSSSVLAGLVLGIFCTSLMTVAGELGVPSYIFFASGAMMLCLMYKFESLGVVDFASSEYVETTVVTDVPGFKNPVPKKVWPKIFLDKDGGAEILFEVARRCRQAKGIMVNTFMELEPSCIRSLSSDDHITAAPIYPVGPVVNSEHVIDSMSDDNEKKNQIMCWLDAQPPASVVYLCFGSKGSFNEEQIKEIAVALERTGQRFLWSLRRRPEVGFNKEAGSGCRPKLSMLPEDYGDFSKVLPEGFLDRTADVGKVIGWAPQVAVLGHKAVGAFVSHCGWNSTLESLWFGVPMLAWPMFAEQQINAFALVEELGLAVEVRVDYVCDRHGANMVVKAEDIEKAIRRMMEGEEGKRIREKVKWVSEMGNKTINMQHSQQGGVHQGSSSYESMGRFIENVVKNVSTN